MWGNGDEAAHYDYVQTIAENHRLPLISDVNHVEVRAIFYRTYPRPAPVDPSRSPLESQSYEAFQPPLYYALATPAFAVLPDHKQKVRAVRVFDAVLLALVAVLLLALARVVAPRNALLGWSAGLAVLIWPAVVVRGTTVSPAPLELLTVTGLVVVLARVLRGGGRRWVLAAGAVLAACILTKSTLAFMVPVWVTVLALDLRRRRDWPAALGAAALCFVLVLPWLVFNKHNYGSWTATEQAQDLQQPIVNPGPKDFSLGDALSSITKLPKSVIPAEWEKQLDVGWVTAVCWLLFAGLVGCALVQCARALRGPRRPGVLFLTAVPAAAALALLVAAMVQADWPTVLGRYLFATLPVLAVGTAVSVKRGTLAWGTVAAATALSAALWIFLGGTYLFTDLGRTLGIA